MVSKSPNMLNIMHMRLEQQATYVTNGHIELDDLAVQREDACITHPMVHPTAPTQCHTGLISLHTGKL